MGTPCAMSLGRPGQFRSFMVISVKVFEHSCIKIDFSNTIQAYTKVSRQYFASGHLILVSHTFTHMNIAKFSRDLEMIWVKRRHI